MQRARRTNVAQLKTKSAVGELKSASSMAPRGDFDANSHQIRHGILRGPDLRVDCRLSSTRLHWRVKERRDYKPELRLHVYDDDWKWKDGEKYRWRDAGKGHGY